MDQPDSDWADWSLGDQVDIDDMLESYKKDESTEDSKDGIAMPGLDGGGELEEDETGSGGSEESGEDEKPVEPVVPKPPVTNGNPRLLNPSRGEGLATCEFCGRVGIRHAFYSKSKRFCSLACSRSFSASAKESKHHRKSGSEANFKAIQMKRRTPQTLIQNKPDPTSFDWSEYLNETQAIAAPVSCFRHCAMSDCWENITVGMKVEVLNTNCDVPYEVFWIATVTRLAGYRALMRYEGFGSDPGHDFWINLCVQDVHPVGWCATNGKPLVPPQAIQHKYTDWKDFLVKRLTGARTLPNNFYDKVLESMHKHPIKPGMKLEVVDKMCVSAMRVATVDEVIGGRLRLHYDDTKTKNPHDEFWCHSESPLAHPVGWSQLVGHKLHATQDYKNASLKKIALKKYEAEDATPEMFRKMKEPSNGLKFQVGMKLEAIDPLNLSTICVATVMKVLRNNFLMIGIDGSMAESGTDWFCYHSTSPYIFPVGFCEINGLPLTPPRTHKGEFKWFDYLKQTRSQAAPVKLFDKEIPKHGFKVGMKLEAVDLMEPRLICVGTVSKVVGRLLRIHFDGWESSYDQWVDCESPDVYSCGWCEMVGFHLEGPKPVEAAPAPPPSLPKKRKTKTQIYRGPRKKRKPKMPIGFPGTKIRGLTSQSSVEMDDLSQDSCSTTDSLHPLTPSTPEAKLDLMELKTAKTHPVHTGSNFENKIAVQDSLHRGSLASSLGNSSSIINDSIPNMPVLQETLNKIQSTAAATAGKLAQVSSTAFLPGVQTMTFAVSSASPNRTKSNLVQASLAAVLNLGGPTTSPPNSVLTQKLTSSPNISLSPQKQSKLPLPPSCSPVVQLPQSPIYTLTGQPLKTASLGAGGDPPLPVVSHHIPRVIPGEPDKDSGYNPHNKDQAITPDLWGVQDVCQFLRVNDCGAYCDSFSKKNITGVKFMTLTKEQIVNLTGMKVGPSLKIYDLIQQLKITVASQQPQRPTTATANLVSSNSAQVAGLKAGDQLTQGQISHMVLSPNITQPQHSPALKAQLTQSSSMPTSL